MRGGDEEEGSAWVDALVDEVGDKVCKWILWLMRLLFKISRLCHSKVIVQFLITFTRSLGVQDVGCIVFC